MSVWKTIMSLLKLRMLLLKTDMFLAQTKMPQKVTYTSAEVGMDGFRAYGFALIVLVFVLVFALIIEWKLAAL